MDSWRLIDSGPCDAFYNMALDEAIAEGVRKGESPVTLRLYGWESPSVSLGCFQRFSGVDAGFCEAAGIPVVRRPTGGRAILHGAELTYSFSSGARKGPLPTGLFDSYGAICSALLGAFLALGFEAESVLKRKAPPGKSPLCFDATSYGEITVGGKKVIGSAQKRWPDGFLQQGSIPMAIDRELSVKVFGGLRAADGIKAIGEIKPSVGLDALKAAVVGSFERAFGLRMVRSGPSPREEELAGELLRRKYHTRHWNFLR